MDPLSTKTLIIHRLRSEGCRITRQREQILDVILDEECATIKEIYNKSRKLDASVGFATVYRMVSLLEQVIVFNYQELDKLEKEMKKT